MSINHQITLKYRYTRINGIFKKHPWITIVFKDEELFLLTYDELFRLSKLPIKINKNDILIKPKTDDVKNETDISFLNVLQLLHSKNEHLLVGQLKMCNYRLNRTRFCTRSVNQYLLIRYSFKFSKLEFIELIKTIKSLLVQNAAQKNHLFLFYDSYPVLKPDDHGFLVGIDLCSDAERFILSNYEDLVLCNTDIDMSMEYYIGCHRKHSEKNKNEFEDLSFNFIDLIYLLSLYENPQRLQRGLNYEFALGNYNMDRSTFKASSVVEYLAIQDPHSFQLQELLFFIYWESEEGKVLLKELTSALKKKTA